MEIHLNKCFYSTQALPVKVKFVANKWGTEHKPWSEQMTSRALDSRHLSIYCPEWDNLATRLIQNLKTSQEIFVGTSAKISLEQKLTEKVSRHKKYIFVTWIQFLAQEFNVCHKNIIPVTRIEFLSKEQISYHRNTFQVTRKFLM